MANRRHFLEAVATTGAAVVLSANARAASPAATPSPAPVATPPPSDKAMLLARGMRAYNPKLSDADVLSIAQDIDDNFKSGKRLNPKAKRLLKNSDEPVTILRVPV